MAWEVVGDGGVVHEGTLMCGDSFSRVVVSQSDKKYLLEKKNMMCHAPSLMNVGGTRLDPSLRSFDL